MLEFFSGAKQVVFIHCAESHQEQTVYLMMLLCRFLYVVVTSLVVDFKRVCRLQ